MPDRKMLERLREICAHRDEDGVEYTRSYWDSLVPQKKSPEENPPAEDNGQLL